MKKYKAIETQNIEILSTSSARNLGESKIKVSENEPSDLGTLEKGPSQPCINFKTNFGNRQQ